jgi:large subunit ribosomal protein L18
MSDLVRKKAIEKNRRRVRAHLRLRRRIFGTPERPRLCVFKSNRYVYAQLVDDTRGVTLAAATSLEPEVKGGIAAGTATLQAARRVGEVIGDRARTLGIERVVFDRGGYRYHGKVKEVAEGARSRGLQF